ncbi:MAG: biopolymer transporter ExbD [Candidatus Fermentibacteraceae bacterium]|nr:biopolymer transporter ExbD [Candidatus Fermentibacteraceae bacterium]MBN2608058.1 biopolymer transporter ExbD [Candidatus Fermentibacteraceae bacterium]
MAKPASGRSHRIRHAPEIDLLPVMNLFCVIIPFLLLSASFLEISIIEMAPTEGISTSGAGTTSLAQSEEQQLQPKVIMTAEQMFLGTVFGTRPISAVTREYRDGELVDTYDYQALSEALGDFREELDREFASIPVHKITILTEDNVRYDNIVMAIDVCADHGFDQPGLQVAAYSVLQRQLNSMTASGGE